MENILTQKGLDTRYKLLESATRVVAKKGIEKASFAQIAKHAKVSRALLLYYIPSKEHLLMSVIRHIVQQFADFLQKNKTEYKTRINLPKEIESRVRVNFAFFGKNPHYFQCMMLFYYRCSYDSECRRYNSEITGALTNEFHQVLLRNQFSNGDAQRLSGLLYRIMFTGIQQVFILDQKILPAERHLKAILWELEWVLTRNVA